MRCNSKREKPQIRNVSSSKFIAIGERAVVICIRDRSSLIFWWNFWKVFKALSESPWNKSRWKLNWQIFRNSSKSKPIDCYATPVQSPTFSKTAAQQHSPPCNFPRQISLKVSENFSWISRQLTFRNVTWDFQWNQIRAAVVSASSWKINFSKTFTFSSFVCIAQFIFSGSTKFTSDSEPVRSD